MWIDDAVGGVSGSSMDRWFYGLLWFNWPSELLGLVPLELAAQLGLGYQGPGLAVLALNVISKDIYFAVVAPVVVFEVKRDLAPSS